MRPGNPRRPRVRRDSLGYLLIDGGTYMGGVRVPPLPNRISMVDRTTGAALILSHTNGPLTIALVPDDPKYSDVSRFGPRDGPYSGDYRLFISNGSLGFERAPGFSSPLILTRRAFDTTVLQITPSTSGAVQYTSYQL